MTKFRNALELIFAIAMWALAVIVLTQLLTLAARSSPSSNSKNPKLGKITLYVSPTAAGYVYGGGTFYSGSTQTIGTVLTNPTAYRWSRWSDGNTNTVRNIVVPVGGVTLYANYAALPPTTFDLSMAWTAPTGYAPNILVYQLGWSPGTNVLTFATSYTVRGLAPGSYAICVRDGQEVQIGAGATNLLWSSYDCVNYP